MITKDKVQSIRIFQDPSRARMRLPRPWANVTEPPAPGDFVQITNGDNMGQEGCIQAIGANFIDEYTISVTSAKSSALSVLLESDIVVEPSTVSKRLPIIIPHHSNLHPQIAPTIFALPAEVIVYKRIQKYDSVRILSGLFVDIVGSVDRIINSTGWYIVKTPTLCLRLYRTHIDLEDRLCVDDLVRITVHGLFFGKQGTIKKVDAEGNIEVAALPSDVSWVSLTHLHSVLNSSLMAENSSPFC